MALLHLTSRRAGQHGGSCWTEIEQYECDHVQVASCKRQFWNSVHPSYAGEYAPRCRRIDVTYNWRRKGKAKLTLLYKTVRQAGVAKLHVELGSQWEKVTRARIGDGTGEQIIDGAIWDDGGQGQNYRRITAGSNLVPKGKARIRLETAYRRSVFTFADVTKKLALCGSVNRHRLPKFGNAAKGTLLLLGAPTTHVWEEDELWYVDYVFAYEPRGWNSITRTQKFCRLAVRVPQIRKTEQNAAEMTGGFSTVLREENRCVERVEDGTFVLSDPTREQGVRLFPEASFGDLEAMVRW